MSVAPVASVASVAVAPSVSAVCKSPVLVHPVPISLSSLSVSYLSYELILINRERVL